MHKKSFGAILILLLTTLAVPSEALVCADHFSSHYKLGIRWTPYTDRKMPTPDPLRDPYVHYAIKSEPFRHFLIKRNRQGIQPSLKDYKSLIDSRPRYDHFLGPEHPKDLSGKTISPGDLSFTELIEYIHANYDISRQEEPNFEPGLFENIDQHPVAQKLSEDKSSKQKELISSALNKAHHMWKDLTRVTPMDTRQGRTTLLWLPNPYVVAGGRFQESYFWDSLWIMRGLIASGYKKVALGMLENFVYMQESYGIMANGNRYYYLTRTQVPLFMEMVQLFKNNGLLDFRKATPQEKNYDPNSLEARILVAANDYYQKIWRNSERYHKNMGLFRYSDGAGGAKDHSRLVIRPEAGLGEARPHETHAKRVYAESGWDMAYSRFGKDPQNWYPIDLNSILMGYTRDLAKLYKDVGNKEKANAFQAESRRLQKNIRKHLLQESTGYYLDRHGPDKKLSSTLTAASFFPFYFGLYAKNETSNETLKKLFQALKPSDHFGIHATNRAHDGQWDGNWTWANLNQVAFKSLMRYGLTQEATELAVDYSAMILKVFAKNQGVFYEKYLSLDGEVNIPDNSEIYGNEIGFGWTNAVFVEFVSHLQQTGKINLLERKLKQLNTPSSSSPQITGNPKPPTTI